MKKERSQNSCLSYIFWCGVIFLCICAPLMVGTAWAGNEIYTAAIATPTEINTCAGMLDVMLNGFYLPEGDTFVTDSMQDLVVYQVSGDQISNPNLLDVPENLKPLRADTASQQRVWDYFVKIIPAEQRTKITEYKIMTDGTGNFNAQVESEVNWDQNSTTEKWSLLVDLADFVDEKQFTSMLLHEFGHILTLNINQLDFKLDAANCPRYFKDNGCSQPDSYLQLFFERFWTGIYDEWHTIASQSDPAAVKSGLEAFYQAHPADFVSQYATTAAHEDIAESWMNFVLSPKLAGDTVAKQKVNFFYEFPELVQIRSELISRICGYFNLPASP
ncbi:MAG: hypothetical protein MUO77_02790 [Anaerolineales bacterium]|nr:hypothetical protein [Anaerolineales bacterium]